MSEIKAHYSRKKLCPAKFCDETYEKLLYRLENRDHDYPLGTISSSDGEKDGIEVVTLSKRVRQVYTKHMVETMTLPYEIGDIIQKRPDILNTIVGIYTYRYKDPTPEMQREMQAAMQQVDLLNFGDPNRRASLMFVEHQNKILVLQ